MTTETTSYLGSMGAMCWLTDVLCWERWGYWSECGGPPAWASNKLTDAKKAAAIAKPADVRYSLEFTSEGLKRHGTFRVWDEANPWAEPNTTNFAEFTEDHARRYYAEEYAKHKRWQEEAINTLIYYREHGELPADGGKPENQRYWLAKGYNPANRVYLKENQPGNICYETFPNPMWEHSPGYISVEIQPHKVNDWYADCYAEGPNQYRRYIGKGIHAETYEDARRQAEEWIEQVARPFIAHEQANPVDYCTVTDVQVTVHHGELSGNVTHPHGVYVKLDNPAAFVGGHVRDGRTWVEWARVTKVEA